MIEIFSFISLIELITQKKKKKKKTRKTPKSLLLQDLFFYQLVYDPNQKTLNADRGEIRVGGKYQADVPTQPLYTDGNDEGNEEKLVII